MRLKSDTKADARAMVSITHILEEVQPVARDRRPFYRYDCTTETFGRLEAALRASAGDGRHIDTVAHGFVFWAAEHIARRFPGGQLTWDFVRDGLGLSEDAYDRTRLTDLVERGLCWWNREVKKSEAGIRMFLYSLMAEGGIPEAFLKQAGRYRGSLLGMLVEIEAEGGKDAASWAESIVARRMSRLPQTFQTREFALLLADLTLELAELRARLPHDLSADEVEGWLNARSPGWASRLPLRMTPEVLESLILPALRAEREARPFASDPLCARELRRGVEGVWCGYLVLHHDGWLPARLFPAAVDQRLRLLPIETRGAAGLNYSAAPEGDGWRVRRFGGRGGMAIPFSPDRPFSFSAFADGKAKGEGVVDPGMPVPTESPSFWRAVEANEPETTDRLTPVTGAPRTRKSNLWFLASETEEPEAEAGVTLEEVETGPGGFLWRISGKGAIRVGDRQFRIETEAADEAPEARLFVLGDTLRGWRLDGNLPVHLGVVSILGQIGAMAPHQIPQEQLRWTPGRTLGGQIVTWERDGEVLARSRVVCFPTDIRLDLQEEIEGTVAFAAKGLKPGWRVRLSAGEAETAGDSHDGAVQLALATSGARPGLVRLRLSEPETGLVLELDAVWPAASGMILDSGGERLAGNRPVAAEELYGWRVVAPDGARGDLQLRLVGPQTQARPVSLPFTGEVSLAMHTPSIQAMLAQGGPDAQVNLNLIVSGRESRRLEIRRYREASDVTDGLLRAGIDRDSPASPNSTLAAGLTKNQRVTCRAIHMREPERVSAIDANGWPNLHAHLGEASGPWFIQPRLDGRLQRAVTWTPEPSEPGKREERIAAYAEEWSRLASVPDDPLWSVVWRLVSAVGFDGDVGALDRVQALAHVPSAAVALTLRVPRDDLIEALALDMAAPIFWPTLPVAAFAEAVKIEHRRQKAKFGAVFADEDEIKELADSHLATRIGDILVQRRQLTAHFGRALVETGLMGRFAPRDGLQDTLRPMFAPKPLDRLTELAQEAARRFDWLPQGVRGLEPLNRPPRLANFNTYLQALIDAPLVAAEMAAGRRKPPSLADKLVLINLRLVDTLYFDAALPIALRRLMESENDRIPPW